MRPIRDRSSDPELLEARRAAQYLPYGFGYYGWTFGSSANTKAIRSLLRGGG